MATSASHKGFHRDHNANTLDIRFDGETATGFTSFETLYAAPTARQLAPLGHGVTDPMGGKWRYCKAGAALTNPLLAAGGYAGWTSITPAVSSVGDWSIDYTASSDASCTVDQYANGAVIIGAAAANRRYYHIKGNTVSATTTGTLQLFHPVRYAIAGTEWATINPCPWADVRILSSASTKMSACCMPLQPVTSGYYFWGKTRGPVFGTVAATVPGEAADDRMVVFNSDGAFIMADESWNAGKSGQYAGYVMLNTNAGGDQAIWLQLE